MTLVDTPDVAARAGTDETSDSSMMLSFDNKSTTELTARDHAFDTPITSATSPNEQGPASKHSDADVIMIDDVEAPRTIDQKVLSALEHQTRSSGTEQQDVEEVIGSIINRLQAAIQPSSIDESTGIQLEKIMETFFVTTVNYTKKFDETTYQSEIGFDRSITAFPAPDGPCSLYDALGRNFDQQVLEESKLSRYTAIKRLPPVLHVLIQRSQAIGRKNNNPVIIPETLYLDRYMDAPHDSDDFKRRIAQWAVGSRLAELKQDEQQLAPPEDTPAQLESHEGELPPPYTETFDPSFDVDGPIDIDFPDAAQVIDEMTMKMAPPVGPSPLRTNPLLETQIRDLLREELSQRDQQLNAELDGLTKYPYRLQAVICHRGHLSSGHYWVWIHDFEDNKWRWYNDADVQENPDTEAVLKQLSSNGEPYYLCYVRDSDKDEHVNVPKRQPAVPDLIQVDSDGDVPLLNSSPTLSDGSERKAPVMEHDDVVGTLL
jgi:ubiquitin carboxyl-terminal hydrolase 25/28